MTKLLEGLGTNIVAQDVHLAAHLHERLKCDTTVALGYL
jgi:hypothetical protein